MNIYLIILLVLQGIGLLAAAYTHKKPKKGDNSFWTTFIAFAITMFLFYKAGVFNLL